VCVCVFEVDTLGRMMSQQYTVLLLF